MSIEEFLILHSTKHVLLSLCFVLTLKKTEYTTSTPQDPGPLYT